MSTPEQRAAHAAYMREWSRRNPEKVRETSRRSRERNREGRNARNREYYQRNRDEVKAKVREYAERNREVVLARKREYGERNRDRISAQRQEERARDPEKHRQQARASYWRNRERILERQRATSAQTRDKRFMAWLWRVHRLRPEGLAAMWDAQEGHCYLCPEALDPKNFRIDHDHSCCPYGRSCAICRRGLAHNNCNAAIGLAGDSPATLRRMADALEAAQRGVEQRKAAAAVQDSLFTGEECA